MSEASQSQVAKTLEVGVIEHIENGHLDEIHGWFMNNDANLVDERDGRIRFHNGRIAILITQSKMTALHYAALYGKADIVEFLLKHGADPSLTNADDETSLGIAMQCKCPDSEIRVVVSYLCQWFQDNHRSESILDTSMEGDSPIALAITQELSGTLEELLKYGIEDCKLSDDQKAFCLQYSVTERNNGEALKILLRHDIWKDTINYVSSESGVPALDVAVQTQNPELVKILIENGANPCLKNKYGSYPIHHLTGSIEDDELELFRRILSELKKSIDIQEDRRGWTALHLAVLRKKPGIAKILVNEFKAKIDIRDKNDKLAQDHVDDDEELMELLKPKSSETEFQDLHKLDEEVIKFIKNGAKNEVEEWFKNKHGQINKYIDKREKNFRFHNDRIFIIIDRHGMTALHYAALYSKNEIAKFLLEIGADPSLKNGKSQVEGRGENPLEIALQSKQNDSAISEVVKTLCDWFCEHGKREMIFSTKRGMDSPLPLAILQNLELALKTLLSYSTDSKNDMDKEQRLNCLRLSLSLCKKGKNEAFNILIEHEMWKNKEILNCSTGILHYAIRHQLFECAEKLVSHGADPAVKDDNGSCPIHYLVKTTVPEEIFRNFLKSLRKSIDAQDSKDRTALHIAVMLNKTKFAKILVREFKADIKIGDKEDKLPLHLLADHKQNEDLVDILADEDLTLAEDKDGYIPLYYAVQKRDHRLVKYLLNKMNALATSSLIRETNFLHMAALNDGGDEDFSAILEAFKAHLNQERIMKELLNLRPKDEETILQRVLKKKLFSRIRILLEYGADPKGQHLLHIAVTLDCTENEFEYLVKQLKDQKEDVLNERDEDYRTPLHHAMNNSEFSRAECLLKNGSNPSLEDRKKRNCLHYAFRLNAPYNLIESLISHKQMSNEIAEDESGKTPLHYMTITTKLAAIKSFNSVEKGSGTAIDEDGQLIYKEEVDAELLLAKANEQAVKVNIEYDEVCRSVKVPAIIKKRDLLRRSTNEFGRYFHSLSICDDTEQQVAVFSEGDMGEKYRLKEGAKFILIEDNITPLEQAIKFKRLDLVKVLLVKGAKLDHRLLEDAIKRKDRPLAQIMIRYVHDIRTPLSSNTKFLVSSPDENEKINPKKVQSEKYQKIFLLLIEKMPDVAKEALDRLVKRKEDGAKSEEKYDKRSKNGDRQHKDGKEEESLQLMELEKGDAKPEEGQTKPEEGDTKPEKKVSFEFDYSFIHSQISRKTFSDYFCGTNTTKDSPIQAMVKHRRTELLQHPVVWTYLYRKWNNLGVWFYFLQLLINLLFLGFLSIFVLAVNKPQSEICLNVTSSNESVGLNSEICGSVVFTFTLAGLVILLAIYHLVIEFIQIFQSRLDYLKDYQNYIQLPLFLFSMVFVFVFANPCGCPKDWQWQIGIFVVLFAWSNLVIFLSKFPRTGVFVLIFKEITKTFLQLASFSVILVGAFSLILFMMFDTPAAKIASFGNVGISFVKTITMVTGELGFEDLFNLGVPPQDYEPLPYSVSNFIMWILFLILIPIILNNMLVSLAVGDAKEVTENAKLEKLILQVETVVIAERVVPYYLKERCMRRIFKTDSDMTEIPFQLKDHLWEKFKLFVFGSADYAKELEETTRIYDENLKVERKEIQNNVDEEDSDIVNTQNRILQRLEKLFELVRSNEDQIRNSQKQLRAVADSLDEVMISFNDK